MRRLVFAKLALLVFVFWTISIDAHANGTLTLRLESGGGASVEIVDNTAADGNGELGVVTFIGPIGNFTNVVATVISKPVLGDSSQANMTMTVISTTSGLGDTLIVAATDTDFIGFGDGTMTSAIGGTTSGTTFFQSFLDANNVAFGTGGCTPGLQGPFTGAFNNTATAVCTLSGYFSMTAEATASIGPNSVQSFGADIMVSTPTEQIGCRFTGGGVDTDGNWNHELENGQTIRNGAGNLPPGIDRYQFGGQVGARTAQDPLPSGEWQHHQQTGPSGSFSFHGGTSSAAPGTQIVDVRCSDPGFCFPARPAPCKQLNFDGIGSFSNLGRGTSKPTFEIPNPNVIPEPEGKKATPFSFHWFEVNIDDLGEPGCLNSGQPGSAECPGRGFGEKSGGPYVPDPVGAPLVSIILPFVELANCVCPDFYRITIYKGVLSTEVTYLPDDRIDPASLDRATRIYEAFGYIDGGNLQIHPPTGYDLK